MKTLDEELAGKHIRDLRVAYLENLLTPEEMSAVERHIQSCAQCRADLEDLKQWENTLRTNKNSVCPEPWELFDYVRSGQDPDGTLREHIDQCALCRSDVEAFTIEPQERGVPSELWEKIADLSVDRDHQGRPTLWEAFFSKLAESWSTFFRIAVPVTGAVAAVVLMVFLLRPTDRSMPPVMGLSSVQWGARLMGPGGMPPVPKAIATNKERLAIVMFFQGFDETPSPRRIDSLYISLKPTAAVLRRYKVVSPLEVKRSLDEDRLGARNRDELCKILHDKLDVSRVVLLTLSERGDVFDIEAELADTTSLKTLRSLDVKGVSETDLASRLKETSQSVLEVR